jgi:hypothetical protein
LQPGDAPPFAVVRERRQRRRHRRGLAGAVGAALVAATGGIVFTQLEGTREVVRTADEPPLPSAVTVGGRRLNLAGPMPVGAARLSGDDTLVISVGAPDVEDSDGICKPYVVVRIASEDTRSVRVIAYNYTAPEAAFVACAGVDYTSKRSVTLEEKLGDREVVDATTDRRLWP